MPMKTKHGYDRGRAWYVFPIEKRNQVMRIVRKLEGRKADLKVKRSKRRIMVQIFY